MHLLNCHPNIRCINEPFNPSNFGGSYLRRVSDLASLDDTLDEIWSSFNGIKHVWHASGWPFTHRRQFNHRLLLKASSRVLLLNRRNILRRVVSSQISEQTKVWSFVGETERQKVRSFVFKPLDIEWLKWQLEFERDAIADKKRMLESAGVDYLELWYEDLYETPQTGPQRVNMINAVIVFLGRGAVEDEPTVRKMRALLNPRNSKLNSRKTYQRIPRIEEIEERFGSDNTGWLFREVAP
jgi:hypothetical protein